MQYATAIVIGAGQSGLAMSRELTRRSVDHLVLEAGRVGESWRARPWESLRLLTPNWMSALPGERYDGPDPAGFMTAAEFVASFDRWQARHRAPVIGGVTVRSLDRTAEGYRIDTDHGPFQCRAAVIATGACALPNAPSFAQDLPPGIAQVTPGDYRRPGDLPPGEVMVVGASASGLQIARELALAGRGVTLAVGNHLRLPRSYRGYDILDWMHLIGVMDEPFTRVDDLDRRRRLPSLPLIGTPDHITLDLNVLQGMGVRIVGRLAGIGGGRALFSGSLANACAAADLKMTRLLDRIDDWAAERGLATLIDPARRAAPTEVPEDPALQLDLTRIGTVVWATGYAPDHRFVRLPVFDRKGAIRHQGGVVDHGLYVMGLRYLRTARSSHIDGAGRDARALARHMMRDLDLSLAA